MPSNLKRTVVRSEAIGKRRGDSGLPIAVKVESIRERQRLPAGRDVSYDSKDGAAKVANPDLDFFNGPVQGRRPGRLHGRPGRQEQGQGDRGGRRAAGAGRPARPEGGGPAPQPARGRRPSGQEFEQTHALAALPDGPVKPGAALGADRGGRSRRRAGAGPQEEVRVRRHREEGGQDPRQDHRQGGRRQVPAGRRFLRAVEADQERPEGHSSEGTILFDREAGRVVESRERLELKGT